MEHIIYRNQAVLHNHHITPMRDHDEFQQACNIETRREHIKSVYPSLRFPFPTIVRIDGDDHRNLRGNFFVFQMIRQDGKQRVQQPRHRDHLQIFLYESARMLKPTVQITQCKETFHDKRNQRFLVGTVDQFDHALHETLHIEQLSRHA